MAANHGDCPLGGLGDRVGDPVPLFELVLPPRAAQLAVPVLGVVTATGVALLVLRSRSLSPGVAPSTNLRHSPETATARRGGP